jgi:hypothetical protein
MENGKMTRREIEELLSQSENENKDKEKVENENPIKLKQARKGIVAFFVIHLLFEIVLSIDMDNSRFVFNNLFLSVFLNFFIAYHFVKWRIEKGAVSQKQNLFNYGVKISFIIFVIRLLLGLLVFFLLK